MCHCTNIAITLAPVRFTTRVATIKALELWCSPCVRVQREQFQLLEFHGIQLKLFPTSTLSSSPFALSLPHCNCSAFPNSMAIQSEMVSFNDFLYLHFLIRLKPHLNSSWFVFVVVLLSTRWRFHEPFQLREPALLLHTLNVPYFIGIDSRALSYLPNWTRSQCALRQQRTHSPLGQIV